MKQNSAGSDGIFGGDAIMAKDNYPNKASQTGTRSITIPRDSTGTEDVGGDDDKSRKNKESDQLDAKRIERQIRERLKMDPEASKLLSCRVWYSRTQER